MIFISNIAFTSFLSVRKWIKLILRLAFIIYFLCPIYCGKRFPVSWESIPSFCGNKFPKYIGILSHNIWDNQNECLSWTRKRKGMVSDYEKNIRQFISILQKNAVNRVKPMWKAALHPKSVYSSMFQSGEGGECRI